MFSHVFVIANAGKENLNCESSMANDDTLGQSRMDWSCKIPTTYFETAALLMTGDLAYDDSSTGLENLLPSLFFGFAMGIIFLNISIAVITDAYYEVQNHETIAFTKNRLAFAVGSESLISVMLLQRLLRNTFLNRMITDIKEIDSDKAQSYQLPYGILEQRLILDELSGEDYNVLKWWFELWEDVHERPSTLSRIKVYFRRASWEELIFPGKTFESFVILGLKHREKIKNSLASRILARLSSYVLCFTLWLAIFVIFLAGCLSFGFLWPEKMREVLFLDEVVTNKNTDDVVSPKSSKSDTAILKPKSSLVESGLSSPITIEDAEC